jgi:hypothetical protein
VLSCGLDPAGREITSYMHKCYGKEEITSLDNMETPAPLFF